MKPYRVKHVPSGLYYQPTKDGNNLSKQGKVYFTSQNCFDHFMKEIGISMNKKSRLLPLLGSISFKECPWDKWRLYCKVPKSEFIKEEL